ncbi:Gldg family protein [Isosphaeraceae bacterium EP7]
MTTVQKKQAGAGIGAGSQPRRRSPFRPSIVSAVFRRNFSGYFSNPAGYVFITLFVFVCSWVAFWQPEFFANNLANLDPLNAWMPYLLLFFIPAITMGAWAEERRQGTEELLLTLPARDVEVVLGKYLAALGIYTTALVFLALGHLPLLSWLGKPDLGVIAATYLGYWLMGAMLIAIGMVASLLSSNVTVGFILGAVFGAIAVYFGMLGALFGPVVRQQVESLSVPAQFQDFGSGVVPLSGVFYFLSLAAAMLYANTVLLGRRNWVGGPRSKALSAHFLVRCLALIVGLAGLNVLIARAGARADVSEERLSTLSPESIRLIDQVSADRPVYIQAYISPDVPREFVETKASLVGLLKEFAARGGNRVQLNLVDTELYSDAARDAETRFGIEPRRVLSRDQAKQQTADVFLGVAFTSGLEEVVVPFFDPGLPVEYELTRSIRVASRSARKKVGILGTDAKLLGGFEFRAMSQAPEWSVVTELKKQYDVSSVAPDAPIPTDLDCLLVAQPSSLTQPQIDTLVAYVKAGRPALLFLDPMPIFDPQLAPEVPKQPPGGMFGGGQPPEPKGDLTPLLTLLGVDWPNTETVWSTYNPHPQLGDLPPEIVFVGRGDAGNDAFNADQPSTSGLQEIVMLFPGLLRPRGVAGLEFTPLLKTGDSGGTIAFRDLTRQGPMGLGPLNQSRRHFATGLAYTLAARIQGSKPAEAKDAKSEEKAAAAINAVVIADLDLISEQFFDLRRQKVANLDFDNVTFVLNCVDTLAGDDSFIALRKRRPRHRTLELFEAQTKNYYDQSQAETKIAETAADDDLARRQKALDEKVAAVSARTDMDDRTKEIMLANLQQVENRRLDVDKANIENQKRRKLQDIKSELERKIRGDQNRFRTLAILIPPLPAFFLGIVVLGVRIRRENTGASPTRLA